MRTNRQLGEFLKARRQGLDPAAVGLAALRRRRTPGLRREEVSERAGISCEWYTKLEQGRDVTPSAETVSALARALMLGPAETTHLRKLADGRMRTFERETMPDTVATIVRGLPDPAYVTGARFDVLVWNSAAEELFGFERMSEADRNVLLIMFTDPNARTLFAEEWFFQAKRMVTLFRVAHDQHGGDPAFEELVARLTHGSAEFASLWSAHEIGSPSAGTKTLHPAGRTSTRYVYATFQFNDDPALKLALYKRDAGGAGVG